MADPRLIYYTTIMRFHDLATGKNSYRLVIDRYEREMQSFYDARQRTDAAISIGEQITRIVQFINGECRR